MSVVLTSADCRQQVLEADVIGDEEEGLLLDHLLAVHPNTIQSETRGMLLKPFAVIQRPLPAA